MVLLKLSLWSYSYKIRYYFSKCITIQSLPLPLGWFIFMFFIVCQWLCFLFVCAVVCIIRSVAIIDLRYMQIVLRSSCLSPILVSILYIFYVGNTCAVSFTFLDRLKDLSNNKDTFMAYILLYIVFFYYTINELSLPFCLFIYIFSCHKHKTGLEINCSFIQILFWIEPFRKFSSIDSRLHIPSHAYIFEINMK